MVKKEDEIKKLKKKIKSLKEEIGNLSTLLADADDSSWDAEGLYTDARDGLFNGNDIEGYKPDKKYAEFIARRYNLEIDEEGEIINKK